MYLGSNRMSRLRLEFRKAVSRALVVVVADPAVVDTPATTTAVVANVADTASENVDSVLTVLFFSHKCLCRQCFILCIWCTCIFIFFLGGEECSVLL